MKLSPFAVPHFFARLLVFAIFVLLLAPFSRAQNLLLNPDFESSFSSGLAANWQDNSSAGAGTVNYSAETAEPHQGSASEKITSAGLAPTGYMQFKQNINVVSGHMYRITVSLRSDQSNLPVSIQLRQIASQYKPYVQSKVTVTQGWQNFRFEGVASATETVFFMLRQTSNGVLWVDDASVEDLGVSIIQNGTFESSFSGGIAANWTNASIGTVTFSQEVTTPACGYSAQKIVSAAGATVQLRQAFSALALGYSYRARISLRASGAPVAVTMQLMNAAGTVYVMRTLTAPVTDWQVFEVDLPVTQSDVTILNLTCTGGATVWVDDVSLLNLAALMISNGNFEGTFSGGLAANWVDGSTPGYLPAYSQDAGENSASSQKIIVSDVSHGPAQFRQGSLPLIKNHTYRIQFSIRCASSSPALVEVQLRKLLNPFTAYLTNVFRPATSWQTYVWEGPVPEDTPPTEKATLVFRFVSPDTIWIDNVSVVDLGARALDLTLTPPITAIPEQMFGIHVLSSSVTSPAPRFPDISVSAWRLWDSGVTWPYLKMTPTLPWNWQTLDAIKSKADNEDTPADLIIPLALSPYWATANADETSAYPSPGGLGWSREPADIADWQEYVSQVATHASNWTHPETARFFEVWNEVSPKAATPFYSGSLAKLAELVQTARDGVRGVNPSNQIISPSVIGSPAYFDLMLRTQHTNGVSIAQMTDIIGYHFYNFTQPEFFIPTVQALRSIIANNPDLQGKPFWNTEFGIVVQPTDPVGYSGNPSWPTSQAADFIARSYVLYWAFGVGRSYYYAWDHSTLGMFDTNTYTDKTEVVNAYDSMRDWLKQTTMISCRRTADGLWIAKLKTASNAIEYVVWHNDPPTGGYLWPTPSGIVQVVTRSSATPTPVGGTITVTTSPVLLQ